MKPLSEQEPEQQSEQKNSKVHQAQQTNTAHVSKPNMGIHERMQHIGREFVDICHYIIPNPKYIVSSTYDYTNT